MYIYIYFSVLVQLIQLPVLSVNKDRSTVLGIMRSEVCQALLFPLFRILTLCQNEYTNKH